MEIPWARSSGPQLLALIERLARMTSPVADGGQGLALAKAAELIKVEESGGALLRLASCVDKTSGRDQALCRGF